VIGPARSGSMGLWADAEVVGSAQTYRLRAIRTPLSRWGAPRAAGEAALGVLVARRRIGPDGARRLRPPNKHVTLGLSTDATGPSRARGWDQAVSESNL
jgi:hypothetical protein